MRPVELNLATRPYRNDVPVAVLLALLAIAAVTFTANNTYAYLTSDAREQALLVELSDHRTRMAAIADEAAALRAELEAVDEPTLRSQAAFVAAVLKERNFSWTRLFNELEEVLPWNVRLATIRPSFNGDRVQIDLTGAAQDMPAFFSFQEELERADSFSNVLPSQYEIAEGREDVSFSMKFDYAPAAPAGTIAGGSAPEKVIVVEAGEDAEQEVAGEVELVEQGEASGEEFSSSTSAAGRSSVRGAAGEAGEASGGPAVAGASAGRGGAGTGNASPGPASGIAASAAGQAAGAAAAGSAAAGPGPSEEGQQASEAAGERDFKPTELLRDEEGKPVGFKPRVAPEKLPTPPPADQSGDATGGAP